MNIHQLQLAYDAGEDRILFRATFLDGGDLQEIRALLTRRIVRNLWPGIVRAFESQLALDKPQASHAKTEMINMAHEESITQFAAAGGFATPFENAAQRFPLGEMPLLIANARFTLNANQPLRINFAPEQGGGFEIAFTPALLHWFCKLLQDAVRSAQWQIELALPGEAAIAPATRTLN